MHRALIESPCCFVRRLGGNRRNEIRFHRLLRHKKVTVLEMAAAAGARCGAVAAGRDVAVIQDTSEIYAGGKELAEKGFGPIGKGGAACWRMWRSRSMLPMAGFWGLPILRCGRARAAKRLHRHATGLTRTRKVIAG